MHKLFLLAFAVSAFILFLILFYRIWMTYIQHKERGWAFQMRADNNKALSSLRITACERVIIMLERITPTSLVMRQNMRTQSASTLQLELIKSVREEFELNVSLQLYVSDDTWNKVKNAKDEVLELVRIAFSKLPENATGIDLSKEVFQIEAMTGNQKISEALRAVKNEIANRY